MHIRRLLFISQHQLHGQEHQRPYQQAASTKILRRLATPVMTVGFILTVSNGLPLKKLLDIIREMQAAVEKLVVKEFCYSSSSVQYRGKSDVNAEHLKHMMQRVNLEG